MRTRVSTKQVHAIVERDPNEGIPIKARMRKMEERLNETQVQVFGITESQKRTEEGLLRMSLRLDDYSGRSDRQFEEMRSLMSQLLSRVGQSIMIAEQAFHWRCSDCPQRPKPPAITAGAVE
jgi:hypothetical protein